MISSYILDKWFPFHAFSQSYRAMPPDFGNAMENKW